VVWIHVAEDKDGWRGVVNCCQLLETAAVCKPYSSLNGWTSWWSVVRGMTSYCMMDHSKGQSLCLRYRENNTVYWGNIEARSCKHCCGRMSVSITYTECVFVALRIHHAMHMRHIVICSLPRSAVFLHIISTARFPKKSYWTQNVCFDFLYNVCLKHFSF